MILYSCDNNEVAIVIDQSQKAKIVSLPMELMVRSSIHSEELFDQLHNDLKDTVYLHLNYDSVLLGKKINTTGLDIRAVIVFKGIDQKEEKLFIQSNGPVMYKGGIYAGSEQIHSLISRIDSSRVANGVPN
jgi:hypothetical protein